MQKPYLTLGLVVRNEAGQISDCLKNLIEVLAETFCEILVVDNNSNDNTRELVGEYSRLNPFLRLISLQDNNMARARNCVLQEGHADWVYFIDADCRISESLWNSLDNILKSSSEEGAAFGGGNQVPTTDSFVSIGIQEISKNPFAHMGSIQARPPKEKRSVSLLSTCNLLVHRQKALQSGGFDEAFAKVGEDLSLSHRLAQAGHLIFEVPQMDVIHLQDRGLVSWCRKMFFYGEAQVHAACKYPRHFYGLRGLQFLLVLLFFIFLIFKPLWAGEFFLIYIILLLTSVSLSSESWVHRCKSVLFIVLSHSFYAMGEVFGVFTSPFFILKNFPRRTPKRENI